MNSEKKLRDCSDCPLCALMPVGPTPGQGPKSAEIMFVGEAPGETEAYAQLPFQGLAGKMFDKLLNSAGIAREKVYVTNLVKGRPTVANKWKKNRPPSKTEIRACAQWLEKEISIVKPLVVVCCGLNSTKHLLGDQVSKSVKMGEIAGRFFPCCSYHLMPIAHPSYLLQYGRENVETTIEQLKQMKEKLNEFRSRKECRG